MGYLISKPRSGSLLPDTLPDILILYQTAVICAQLASHSIHFSKNWLQTGKQNKKSVAWEGQLGCGKKVLNAVKRKVSCCWEKGLLFFHTHPRYSAFILDLLYLTFAAKSWLDLLPVTHQGHQRESSSFTSAQGLLVMRRSS